MANNTIAGLTRIIKAAGYSWKGLRAAWTNEAAFRQEGVAGIVGGGHRPLAGCGRNYPRAAYQLRDAGGMIVEILNSAIEVVVDRIGSEYRELSRRAKDMGSAAVLIAIIVAVITWCILLWSHYR
ncbi:diacylglycerol kinase [Escherichia coli]|nr:diacylglycerol kinase [Escherichia coli]